jgi:DNA-directed RNA polymerase specialized sigma24 family protein
MRPPPTPEAPEAAAPGDLEEEALRRLTLAAALARLGERDRELISLRYGADLSARQIAEVVGARTNAVEVSLHRALTRLRGHLEEEGRTARRFRPAAGSLVSRACKESPDSGGTQCEAAILQRKGNA